jgi:O-acetylserine/cysteine efflux transporter
MALAVPMIWGMGFTFAKPVVEHFPPILLMALRFTVTALVLVWFVKPPWHLMRDIFFIALISAAVQYGLTFNGLRLLDASTAVLVIQLEVPFCTLLAIFFLKEQTSLRKWLGMAIAFGGVALIAGEPRLAGNHTGILLTIGGAFTWAVGQVMIRRLGQVGGFTLIAWVAVFATPQLFVASALFEDNQIEAIRSAGWMVGGTVVYLGIVMTAVGYGFWYHLLGKYPVAQVAPFLLLLPIFTVIASILLLGETLTPWLLAGGAVVIVGIAVIVIKRPGNA